MQQPEPVLSIDVEPDAPSARDYAEFLRSFATVMRSASPNHTKLIGAANELVRLAQIEERALAAYAKSGESGGISGVGIRAILGQSASASSGGLAAAGGTLAATQRAATQESTNE